MPGTGRPSPTNLATCFCSLSSSPRWPPTRTCSASKTRSTPSTTSSIRRHPHVFGDGDAKTAEQVKVRWDEIKSKEKSAQGRKNFLDGISRSQPALAEAQQISSRVAGVGFDWENTDQVIAKLHEELDELDRGPPSRRRKWKTKSATCSSWSSTSRGA